MTLASQILATQSANLQAYWPCDESSGTTVYDLKNSNDLALTGSYTLAQTGQSGDAIQFNGTGYASRTDSVLGSSPAAFTIFGLCKGASQSGGRLVAFGNSIDNDPLITISADSAAYQAFIRDRDQSTLFLSSAGTLFDSTWHSFALVWDGTNYSMLIDDSVVSGPTSGTMADVTLTRTAIGALVRAAAGNYFTGLIQHVAIWDTGLSSAELTDIFDQTGLSTPTPQMVSNFGIAGITDGGFSYRAKANVDSTIKIEYSTSPDLATSTTSTGVAVTSSTDHCGGESITGLSADTTYYYSILVDDVRQHSSTFPRFKTTPTAGVDAAIKVVFGSCIDTSSFEAFASMAGESPDFAISLGDLGYIDSTLVAVHRSALQTLFSGTFQSEIVDAMALERMPDDHDLVANNCNGDSTGMADAKQVWLEVHPRAALANESNGLWRKFTAANCEFFMLDTRFQREGTTARFPASSTNVADTGSTGTTLVLRAADSPSGTDDFYNGWYVLVEGVYRRVTDYDGSMRTATLDASVTGLDSSSTYFLKRASMLDQSALATNDQVSWLIDGVNNSTKRWKFIATPSVWNPTVDQADDSDVWGDWDSEQMESQYLRQEITADNIIVLSGDRHWAAIDDGTNSVWPEISASPITRNTYLTGTAGTWTEGAENSVRHYGMIEVGTSPHQVTLTVRLSDGTTSTVVDPLIVADAGGSSIGSIAMHYRKLRAV